MTLKRPSEIGPGPGPAGALHGPPGAPPGGSEGRGQASPLGHGAGSPKAAQKKKPKAEQRKKLPGVSPKASLLGRPRQTESQRKNQRSFALAAEKRTAFLASLPPHDRAQMPAAGAPTELLMGACVARVLQPTDGEKAVLASVFGAHAPKAA